MLAEFVCGCSLPASALHKCLLVCLWDQSSGALGPAHTSSWGPAMRISSQLSNQWLQWNIYTMETGKCYKTCHPLLPICFGMWKNRVLVTIHFMSPSFCFFICNGIMDTPRDNVYNMLSVFYAATKSLQSCPTLCDPIDGSPPGSRIPGILQARIQEWVAISFSNACMLSHFSHVWLYVTLWTAAHQAPLSTMCCYYLFHPKMMIIFWNISGY